MGVLPAVSAVVWGAEQSISCQLWACSKWQRSVAQHLTRPD